MFHIGKLKIMKHTLTPFTMGHDQLVFKLVKIQLVTDSVSDASVSDMFS